MGSGGLFLKPGLFREIYEAGEVNPREFSCFSLIKSTGARAVRR
jgi:hypothetical protein